MPVQTVGPENDLLHVSQVPRSHVEVFTLAAECAGFRKNRNVHENGIAPTAVERHEFFEFTGVRKPDVRRSYHEFRSAFVSGALREFEEQHMCGQRTLRRCSKTVFGTIQVRLDESIHLCRMTKT